jgi:hypothetical protein
MTSRQRSALRQLYQFRCGYCGTSEADVGAELTVDHFRPRSQGGEEEASNWVYCCHACNEFKGDLWQPESTRRLLHPLHDDLTVHLVEQPDGRLLGLTETGRFHIERLHLNLPPMVLRRRAQRENAHLHQAVDEVAASVRELRREIAQVEQALRELRQRLE